VARRMDSSRVQLIIALIGFAGVVAAALISNRGKVMPDDSANGTHENSVSNIEAASVPSVAGPWRDNHGFQYQVDQSGSDYSFRIYKGGALVGTGNGHLTGRSFHTTYIADGDAGECEGRVEVAPDLIVGSCVYRQAAFQSVMVR